LKRHEFFIELAMADKDITIGRVINAMGMIASRRESYYSFSGSYCSFFDEASGLILQAFSTGFGNRNPS
jgi:hypothetical protein